MPLAHDGHAAHRPSVCAALGPCVLLVQPWDWLEPLIATLQDWLRSDVLQELPANAGLFLITGGLSILTLIVSLVFLQSVLPVRGGAPILAPNTRAERELRPLRGPSQRNALPVVTAPARAKGLNYHSVDSLMESLVNAGLGEPRILRHQNEVTEIRLYYCSGCRAEGGALSLSGTCDREVAALEAAFRTFYRRPVKAREASCRTAAEPYCQFEVTH